MALAKTVRSYAELVQLLETTHTAHRANPAQQTVDLIVPSADLPGPTHVRWEKGLPLVQLIQPIVVDVPAARVRDVELAVLRLNNAILFPGLAFDHVSRCAYFRITAVVLLDGIRLDLLQAYFQGVVLNARELRGPLLKVVEGLAGDAVLGPLSQAS
jgi:hypothetical protein